MLKNKKDQEYLELNLYKRNWTIQNKRNIVTTQLNYWYTTEQICYIIYYLIKWNPWNQWN